jgi:hypothetical protein
MNRMNKMNKMNEMNEMNKMNKIDKIDKITKMKRNTTRRGAPTAGWKQLLGPSSTPSMEHPCSPSLSLSAPNPLSTAHRQSPKLSPSRTPTPASDEHIRPSSTLAVWAPVMEYQ